MNVQYSSVADFGGCPCGRPVQNHNGSREHTIDMHCFALAFGTQVAMGSLTFLGPQKLVPPLPISKTMPWGNFGS